MLERLSPGKERFIYLAVWLDTEGSISLSKSKGYKDRTYWRPEIRFTNTNYEAIKLLADLTYGHIKVRKSKKYKEAYDVKLPVKQCRELLPRIIPFLVIKYRQAILLREALDLLDADKHLTGGSGEWQQRSLMKVKANRERLREIFTDMKTLNRRRKVYGNQIHLVSSM